MNIRMLARGARCKDYLVAAWGSPMLTTWASLIVRSASLLVLLPMALRILAPEEIALWQTYILFISLQLIIDMGFSATLTRFASYAHGVDARKSRAIYGKSTGDLPVYTIPELYTNSQWIFKRLSVVYIVILLAAGSWIVNRRILDLSEISITSRLDAWLAWGVVILGGAVGLYQNSLIAILQGAGKLAALKRWECFMGLCSIVSSYVVLIITRNIFYLILANQVWVLLSLLRNKLRVRECLLGAEPAEYNKHAAQVLFSAAWRSGVGVLFSIGLTQLSTLVITAKISGAKAASFLLAVRLLTTMSSFSQAPFYSSLPQLGVMYAQGEVSGLLKKARAGMLYSLVCFCVGYCILSAAGPSLLKFTGSQTELPSRFVWILLGASMLLERLGGMHMQLYTLSGNVEWHLASGGSAVLSIGCMVIAWPFLQEAAVPLGWLVGVGGFYMIYAMRRSYMHYQLRFASFDSGAICLAAPLFLFSACVYSN